MPHRDPNPIFFDSAVEAALTDAGDANVKLPDNHPKYPGLVVGKIIKNTKNDNYYTAYYYDAKEDKLIFALGSFTSIDCAIARLEYRDGRLSTKPNREFACPDCGKIVRNVMLDGPIYNRAIPKLVNSQLSVVIADTWRNGHYRSVEGYTLHKCQKEAAVTV